MNTLNAEQKIWLAKMLPNNLRIDGIGELWWIKDASESVRWPVKPTEHLHLVSLVEAKIPCSKTLDYQELLVRAAFNPEKSALHPDNYEWHATASQRCTALMEVMK